MTASHDYRMADLEAENAKLRADLAEARKSLDALRAAPSDAEIESWRDGAMADSIDDGAADAPSPDDIGTDQEAFSVLRSEIDKAVALMRRAKSAPAPSALVVEAKNILAIIDAARARMDHAGIDLAHGNHVILDHEGAINRLRAALAASPSAQPVAVPENVLHAARDRDMPDSASQLVMSDWILSLAAQQPATPAAPMDRTDEWERRKDAARQPDAELQRLLDEFRQINDDNGWASAQTRLLEALARKVGCE